MSLFEVQQPTEVSASKPVTTDDSPRFSLKDFATPARCFWPTVFWSWNDRLEDDEVRRQVADFPKRQIGGAFLHSRIGLKTPYMGEAWFDAVAAAINEAQKHDFIVWLYDEDCWPSGYGGGEVSRADETFRLKTIYAMPQGSPAFENSRLLTSQGGLDIYVYTVPLGDNRYNGASYSDLLNPDAMDAFLRYAYEPYRTRFKKHFGGCVAGVFTDEPSAIDWRTALPFGSLAFTPGLLIEFEKQFGYDPVPHLHLLFQDGDGAKAFRLHYHLTVSRLFERSFTQKLADWCQKNGLDFTGHFMAEAPLFNQHMWATRVMPNYAHMSIPGIDHLKRDVSDEWAAWQCASVAHQYGKSRILSEIYGVSGHNLTFEDRFWIGCQQLVNGVNLFCHHLSAYTMNGCRKRDYPPVLSYQQPWWEANEVVDRPISRACYALSRGNPVVDTLVLMPRDSIHGHWQSAPAQPDQLPQLWSGVMDIPTLTSADDFQADLKAITQALIKQNRLFDFGDEELLARDGEVVQAEHGPQLRIGSMDYQTVILPPVTMLRESIFELLLEFVAAGGRLCTVGESECQLVSEKKLAVRPMESPFQQVSFEQLPDWINQTETLISMKATDPASVRHCVRRLENDEYLVFLCNLKRDADSELTLWMPRAGLKAHELSLDNGTSAPLEGQARAHINLHLHPGDGRLFHLTETSTTKTSRRDAGWPNGAMVEIPMEAFQVSLDSPNVLPLDLAHFKTAGSDWTSRAVPLRAIKEHLDLQNYRGELMLMFPFEVAPDWSGSLSLVDEYHGNEAELSLNGVPVNEGCGLHWVDRQWIPRSLDDVIKPGLNKLVFRFTDFQRTSIANKEYGTELETPFILGDFSLCTRQVQPCKAVEDHRQCQPYQYNSYWLEDSSFRIEKARALNAGDITNQGAPFYCGNLVLEAPLPDTVVGGVWTLQSERLAAICAKVEIGGRQAGHLWRRPYTLSLGRIDDGERNLRITLYGSLRNAFGPHHHPVGELGLVGPESFLPDFKYGTDLTAPLSEWIEHDKEPEPWCSEYCVIEFGTLGKLTLTRTA